MSLSQTQSISKIVLEASLSVSCLVMSYFWYQNAKSISDSRRRARYEELYVPISINKWTTTYPSMSTANTNTSNTANTNGTGTHPSPLFNTSNTSNDQTGSSTIPVSTQ